MAKSEPMPLTGELLRSLNARLQCVFDDLSQAQLDVSRIADKLGCDL